MDVSTRVVAVWAPLSKLAGYEHHPDKTSIGRLVARARELAKASASDMGRGIASAAKKPSKRDVKALTPGTSSGGPCG